MVSYEELMKIAALAKLSLEGEDTDKLLSDMSDMVEFADQVSKAGLSGDGGREREPSMLRADVPEPSLTPDEVLKNAHERSENFFLARGKGLTTEE